MRNLYKVLLVLVLVAAGVGYYAKTRNLDLKSWFNSSCDCHGGSCSVKKTNMPAAMPEAEDHAHASHAAVPAVHTAPAIPAHVAPTAPAHAANVPHPAAQPAPVKRAFSTPAAAPVAQPVKPAVK